MHLGDLSLWGCELALNSSRLSSLRLDLTGDPPQEENTEMTRLAVPQETPTPALTDLGLTLRGIELDWDSESLLQWVGKRLQAFSLKS